MSPEIIRLIIAGSRDFNDSKLLEEEVLHFLEGSTGAVEVLSGCAKGADTLGEELAKKFGLVCHKMPADWSTHGKAAGYKRNEAMADRATHCIVFWDGQSRGSKHMWDIATRKNLIRRLVMT